MARLKSYLYDIQFFINKPGYRTYTWLISRANYRRDNSLSSYTIWLYTTDYADTYDLWKFGDISFDDFIRYIKSRSTTKVYNEPFFY